MFRELLAILRSNDPMSGTYGDLLSMVHTSELMFDLAWRHAVSGRVSAEAREKVRRMDVDVNKAERGIRKSLVEHVVAYGLGDLPACLALMSVVKDAERLGDYCKQILDAASKQDQGLSHASAFDSFQAAYEDTHGLFEKTMRALEASDTSLARQVMLAEREIRDRCDAILDSLLTENSPSRRGIPWAMIVWHLKRIVAHLSNIASSLVMPLHKIDCHDIAYLDGPDVRKKD